MQKARVHVVHRLFLPCAAVGDKHTQQEPRGRGENAGVNHYRQDRLKMQRPTGVQGHWRPTGDVEDVHMQHARVAVQQSCRYAAWLGFRGRALAYHGEMGSLTTGKLWAANLRSGESLQNCVDPSILSIFEDVPTIETRGLDEESEATLLTALTEILDNVDDENLSPFDMLPDSELLSKGRETSPLRKMLCLSRSPQKDSLCGTRPLSGGKSLSRMQAVWVQRSDGEEEEDGSFTRSPGRHESSPDLPGWEGLSLPIPIMLEQGVEDGLSVSLGDLVRHMHPYCMTVSIENEEGEQMLPEGGIVLEVVDQGENGEPIFAIQNMDLSYPLHQPLPEKEMKQEAAEDELTDSSEHIVVDEEDDVTVGQTFATATAITPAADLDVKAELVRTKKEKRKTSPLRRKKKSIEKQLPELAEGRVLRSGTVRRVATDNQKKPQKRSGKDKVQKSQKVPSTSTLSPAPKPEGLKQCKGKKENSTEAQVPVKIEKPATPLLPSLNTTATTKESLLTCPAVAMSAQQPNETPNQSVTTPAEKTDCPSTAPSVSLPPISSERPTDGISISPAVQESKPKSLSLEEYRRLRQQKKPPPVEKPEKSVTKWPSLPELPKELPPLPHLPDPNPRDPRRVNPQAVKEVEEVKPAWQPRGPCAPPTPEALLQPPAYMISSSSKASAGNPVSKPQQTQDPSKLPQKTPTALSNSANTSAAHPQTTVKLSEPCVPQSSAPPASLKPLAQVAASAERESSPSDSERTDESKSINPPCVQDTKVCEEITTDIQKPAVSSGSVHHVTAAHQKMPEVTVPTSLGDPLTAHRKSSKPTAKEQTLQPRVAFPAHNFTNKSPAVEYKQGSIAAIGPLRAKSNAQELIESFTSEMGIVAADLTSLLEQFEETQAKEEKYVPEVSGRAAAVGNSRVASIPKKTFECVRANYLSRAAAVAPKATPPNQMWKPLASATLVGKTNTSGASKPSPSKVIQIDAQPLPSLRLYSKATPAAATVAPDLACMDHDYCLSNKNVPPGEPGKRLNVKQQFVFNIKSLKQLSSVPPPTALAASPKSSTNLEIASKKQDCPQTIQAKNAEEESEKCPVMETADASPSPQQSAPRPRRGPSGRSYRNHVASRSPSPTCSPEERTRGRSRKRFYRSPSPTSSCSDAYSSRSRSRSTSPAKKRYRHRSSDSSLSASSRSSSRSSPSLSRSPQRRRRYSYSSSRSGSWSRSRSPSLSPQRQAQWSRSRGLHSPSYVSRYCPGPKPNAEETKGRKEKAIEERRVVYVGRIRGSMTQRELRERFSLFGEIEECTLHFREHGDNYGFVTYYNTKDAFTAIENGGKLRKPDELPFDLCFGGRRQFCQSSYADLDSSREYDPLSTKGKYHALDFDTLLQQARQNLKR